MKKLIFLLGILLIILCKETKKIDYSSAVFWVSISLTFIAKPFYEYESELLILGRAFGGATNIRSLLKGYD